MRNNQLGMAMPPLEELGIDTKGLEDLLGQVDKFAAERQKIAHRISGAERELAQARRADDRDYAKALQEGKAAPEPKHLKEAEGKIEELRRRERALGTLIEDLTQEARRHIFEHVSSWKKRAEKALPDATSRYEAAIQELVEARGRFYATWAAIKWMDDPEGKFQPRTGESPVSLDLDKAPGFGSQRQVTLGPVLEGLRYEAGGPEREKAKRDAPRVEMHAGQPQRRVS